MLVANYSRMLYVYVILFFTFLRSIFSKLVEDRVERSENRVKRCRFDYGHTWFSIEIGPWEMLCHVI